MIAVHGVASFPNQSEMSSRCQQSVTYIAHWIRMSPSRRRFGSLFLSFPDKTAAVRARACTDMSKTLKDRLRDPAL